MSAQMSKTTKLLDVHTEFGAYHLFEQHGEFGEVTSSLVLSTADWEDMGAPVKVTVSVEPGDRLNPA